MKLNIRFTLRAAFCAALPLVCGATMASAMALPTVSSQTTFSPSHVSANSKMSKGLNNFSGRRGAATPFDFDGDSKTDISVFSPSTGTWAIRSSSDKSVSYVGFGMNGDLITRVILMEMAKMTFLFFAHQTELGIVLTALMETLSQSSLARAETFLWPVILTVTAKRTLQCSAQQTALGIV